MAGIEWEGHVIGLIRLRNVRLTDIDDLGQNLSFVIQKNDTSRIFEFQRVNALNVINDRRAEDSSAHVEYYWITYCCHAAGFIPGCHSWQWGHFLTLFLRGDPQKWHSIMPTAEAFDLPTH